MMIFPMIWRTLMTTGEIICLNRILISLTSALQELQNARHNGSAYQEERKT